MALSVPRAMGCARAAKGASRPRGAFGIGRAAGTPHPCPSGVRSGAVPSAGEVPGAVQVVSSNSNETNHQQLKTKRKQSPSGVSRAGRGVRTSWSWGQGKEEPKSWKHTNEGEKKIKKKGKK